MPDSSRLADPQPAGEVAGVDVGDQAVLGVVGQPDRLVLVVEGDDRRHRAEDLLARGSPSPAARRRARSARSRSRARSGRRAADDAPRRPRPTAPRTSSSTLSTASSLTSGPPGCRRRAGADAQRAHPLGEPAANSSATDALDVEAVGRGARLAAVAHLGDHRAVERGVEVGVGEDEERRVAAELHRAVDDLVGRLLEQHPADLGRAGERQLAHPRVVQHRRRRPRRTAGPAAR